MNRLRAYKKEGRLNTRLYVLKFPEGQVNVNPDQFLYTRTTTDHNFRGYKLKLQQIYAMSQELKDKLISSFFLQ